MGKKIISTCTCCRTETEVEYFDLLVLGSEGVWLCLECRKATCDFISERSNVFFRAKRDAALERKRIRDAA